ncbi:MAG: M20/M25/M40 family metallo-hydrolase [Lachnospiraceae bacterium]|jgi:carboxypeptidase PM20D1|nr:M20/M25/M40 family metallo-hydrolase [Lachnospiraceae bacterium]
MFIFLIVIALILLFLAVLLIRAALFKPAAKEKTNFEAVSVNSEKAVANLQELVRCKTVSYHDHTLEDEAEFQKLLGLLPKLYPNVWKTCAFRRFPDRGIMFTWKGTNEATGGKGAGESEQAEAAVLMAHYDVVPVDAANWQEPPFDAVIRDGVMWGRGTLDTKVTFNGILTAADELIAAGFRPKQDIYMAFSGQEEIDGPGATHAVDYFRENKIKLSMVVDEGGAVVRGVFPGISGPCAMVGIAEKGLLDLSYKVRSEGGHASAPKPHSSFGVLARALQRVEAHPMKMILSEPVRKMFDTLGSESTFGCRILFANLWAFGWILDLATRKKGGTFNALLRTTVAFTQMQGSPVPNVIPTEASLLSNIRIAPTDSIEHVKQELEKRIADDRVKLEVSGDYSMDPSPVSRTDCDGWKRVVNAVQGTWKGSLVTPYLMVQCSDSRHYRDISDRVYRFSAMDLTAEEMELIHGNNERIRLDVVARSTEFFYRLIRQC